MSVLTKLRFFGENICFFNNLKPLLLGDFKNFCIDEMIILEFRFIALEKATLLEAMNSENYFSTTVHIMILGSDARRHVAVDC